VRVLVLGGTGWVGHHVVLQFRRAGYDVTAVSRANKQDFISELPAGVKRLIADKESESDMTALLENRLDVVIDTVPKERTIDLIFRHARGLRRYIHCSSTGGYAPLKVIPGDETQPYEAVFGSGWAQKRVVDEKVMRLCREVGFPATVIRPSYISGVGALPLDNLGGRRPGFIADILREAEITLPNDGRALLQPVDVTDLAFSFLQCALTDVGVGQIYNICQAKAVTLTRYVEITAAALGRRARLVYAPLREMLIAHRDDADETGLRFLAEHMCFDIGKARRQLGYEPSLTTERAIERAAVWAAGGPERHS